MATISWKAAIPGAWRDAANTLSSAPVFVRKGSLPDQVPHRDLHVTKGHSLYIDGVLIPMGTLDSTWASP